jgi:hypothetical protein
MDTSECPANMCEHGLDDHMVVMLRGRPVRCTHPGCQCGIIKLSKEFWDKLKKDDG